MSNGDTDRISQEEAFRLKVESIFWNTLKSEKLTQKDIDDSIRRIIKEVISERELTAEEVEVIKEHIKESIKLTILSHDRECKTALFASIYRIIILILSIFTIIFLAGQYFIMRSMLLIK